MAQAAPQLLDTAQQTLPPAQDAVLQTDPSAHDAGVQCSLAQEPLPAAPQPPAQSPAAAVGVQTDLALCERQVQTEGQELGSGRQTQKLVQSPAGVATNPGMTIITISNPSIHLLAPGE